MRVDAITSIDLAKQTFTADLWVFVITAEKFADLKPDTQKKVEEFLGKFVQEDKSKATQDKFEELVGFLGKFIPEDKLKPGEEPKEPKLGEKPKQACKNCWIASQNVITTQPSDDQTRPNYYELDGQKGLVWRRASEV